MSGSHVLLELVVVLGMAAAVTVIFQALHLPVVLGYVLAGLLIGPHVPVPLVADPHLVHVLSELGVILLMFTVGLELKLSTIARVGLPAALTAVFEVAFVIAIGTLVATLLGFDPTTAFFVGACLGISSTMLVAKAFEDLGWKGGFTEVVFAILVFEDLIAILLLAVLAGVASGAGLGGSELLVMVGKLTGFLVVMLLGGLLIVPPAIRWVAKRARVETLLIVGLVACFGFSTAAAEAGYSVALGAFVAGVLVAESGHGHDVFELVKPFRDVFAMVFFVSVGMTIEPGALLSEAPTILVLTTIVLFVKPLGVTIGVFLSGKGLVQAVRSGVSLAQIGELSFVIGGIAGGGRLLPIAVGVSVLTTLTSPILIRQSEHLAEKVASRLPKQIATFVSFYESWITRLRERPPGSWHRYRRAVTVLIVDLGVIVTVVIVAATAGPKVLANAGIVDWPARLVLAGVALTLCLPFMISMVRRIAVIAKRLAAEVIPIGEPVDLGRAPRRALVVTIELALALAIAVPLVAFVQPFVPGSPIIAVVVVLVLVVIMRRSIADFEGHVRAGSELVLELISHKAETDVPLAQLDTILPGFAGLTSVTLVPGAPAVGQTLATLDLRARSGATVLAIGRGDGGLATPSPTVPLQAGDVLALAGSVESIRTARAILEQTGQDGHGIAS